MASSTTNDALDITQDGTGIGIDLEHDGADGFAAFVDQTNVANSEDVIRIDVVGDGDALNVNADGGGNGLDIDMGPTTTNDALSITHDGAGDGLDVNMNPLSTDQAVSIEHFGTGVGVLSRGFGGGEAAVFVETDIATAVFVDEFAAGEGLVVLERGPGDGIGIDESGAGWGLGIFEADGGDALHIETDGDGRGLELQQNSTTSPAARIRILAPGSSENVLILGTAGTGDALQVNSGRVDADDVDNEFGDGATDVTQLTVDGVVTGAPAANSDFDFRVLGDAEVTGTLSVATLGGGFSQGSIIFADGSGNLAEDNANLNWNDANDALSVTSATGNRMVDLDQQGASGQGMRLRTTNAANNNDVLTVAQQGTGRGLNLNHSGTGGQAGRIQVSNAANGSNALSVETGRKRKRP